MRFSEYSASATSSSIRNALFRNHSFPGEFISRRAPMRLSVSCGRRNPPHWLRRLADLTALPEPARSGRSDDSKHGTGDQQFPSFVRPLESHHRHNGGVSETRPCWESDQAAICSKIRSKITHRASQRIALRGRGRRFPPRHRPVRFHDCGFVPSNAICSPLPDLANCISRFDFANSRPASWPAIHTWDRKHSPA